MQLRHLIYQEDARASFPCGLSMHRFLTERGGEYARYKHVATSRLEHVTCEACIIANMKESK